MRLQNPINLNFDPKELKTISQLAFLKFKLPILMTIHSSSVFQQNQQYRHAKAVASLFWLFKRLLAFYHAICKPPLTHQQ